MKTYNWEQVIKVLRENNNLKFQTKDRRMIAELDESKLIRFKDEAGMELSLCALNTNEEFVIIQKQISFMEAIKAYSEGKTIMCEISKNNEKCTLIYTENECDELICDFGEAISSYEILNGKWYIEEEI